VTNELGTAYGAARTEAKALGPTRDVLPSGSENKVKRFYSSEASEQRDSVKPLKRRALF